MSLFSLDQLHAAAALVHARMHPTPQYRWPLLAERLGVEVWVKHENHTPTGAFKVRGGIVLLDDLARGDAPSRIITATRGNHGQSIPFAAASHGIAVEVWVPHGNAVEKNAAMRAWGAELVVHGHDFEAARLAAVARAEETRALVIPPFDERLVRGVATYALELFTAVELDAVYVPVGMGSGACGLIQARDLLGLATEIIPVVSTHADAYAQSFEQGRVVTTDSAPTFADGVACRAPWPQPLEILCRGAERIVRVSDDEVAEAMRIYHRDTHNMAEPAGAVPLAALVQERERMRGKRVGVILCGGNVDLAVYAQVLSGQTPTA